MLLVLFFGSDSCEDCEEGWGWLKMWLREDNDHHQLVYVNALDDRTQRLCDYYDVDELPHVAVISTSIPEEITNAIGLPALPDLIAILRQQQQR